MRTIRSVLASSALLLGAAPVLTPSSAAAPARAGSAPAQERVAPETLAALAARCGSRIDWADDWDDAVARSRRERRPILLVVYLYGNIQVGLDLTLLPRITTFENDTIVELVNRRFVPLWFERGAAEEFEQRYGMGPLSFGRGLFVVERDGTTVAEFEPADTPLLVEPFLRSQLEPVALPKPRRVGRADASERVEYATELAADGALDAALAWLDGAEGEAAQRLRGDILARLRRGEEALAAWALARTAGGAGDDGGDDGAYLLREATIRVALGELEDASIDAELALASDDPDVRADVLTLQVGLALSDGDRARAERLLHRLCAEHPDHPRGWAAAGLLVSGVLDFVDKVDPSWAPAARIDAVVTPPPSHPMDVDDTAAALLDGARWLVEAQRVSGAWAAAHALRDEPTAKAHAFTEAATALAVRALLRSEVEGADAAIERGLAFLRARAAARVVDRPEPAGMDYTPWANAMLLEAVVDAYAAERLSKTQFDAAILGLAADLVSRVQRDGGWGYYAPPSGNGGSASISMSFTTAAVVLGLVRARDAGAVGLDDLIDGGVEALGGMRTDDGWYAYSAYEGNAGLESVARVGAIGRGPVCELALRLAGEVAERDVRKAVERFFDGADDLAAERGKILMHCGPGGLGCHYVLFDYLGAARAMAATDVRPREALTLIERIGELRRADGSFVDTPITGPSFGTAAALLALDELRPPDSRAAGRR